MKVQLPEYVITIIRSFEKKGFEIYVVGGAVRDILMGKMTNDWDFTTNATPDESLKIFPDAYYANEYGMVGIPNPDPTERPFEITTFRTEQGYSDARRPDKVEWGDSLEEDLKRRDFTINAMALKITSPKLQETANKDSLITVDAELIDHFAGQKDLEKKLIRAVGDPQERFAEDALRMMRAVRIAAELGFTIEEETFEAIRQGVSLINKISKERVRDELFKILKSAYPYEGVVILKNCGLIDEILPEMSKTFGVEQKSPGRHHIHDVGTHSLLSMKHTPSDDPIVRFAALIHDIGKPQTYKKLESGTITFYNHELVSAKIALRIAERLRFSNKQTERLYKLVRFHQFTVDENQTDSAIRRFIRNVGLENVDDMLSLRIGDRLGGGARETSWRLEEFKKRLVEVQKQPFAVKDLKISGNDVMKELDLPPGPKVGEILEKLFEEVVEQKIANEREELLKRLRTIAP